MGIPPIQSWRGLFLLHWYGRQNPQSSFTTSSTEADIRLLQSDPKGCFWFLRIKKIKSFVAQIIFIFYFCDHIHIQSFKAVCHIVLNVYPGRTFSVQDFKEKAVRKHKQSDLRNSLSVKTNSVMNSVPESGARVTFLCFYWNVTCICDLKCNYLLSERPTLNVLGRFLTHSFILLMMQRSRLYVNFHFKA